MPALEARAREFVVWRPPGAVAASNDRGAVRRAACDFRQGHLPLERIGQSDDDHTLLEEELARPDEPDAR